ncbi:UNVERIFIED_CONTAM: hypothetical protein Sradi_5705000 [Sesamum radiatum]|uniref:Endonuclease/exonuclease/phosphatase domain-containing protein n=1 Tax=Sesamum radiatum TaxID=300843 RepID=A0AAW2L3Q8_SESRA
MQALTQMVEHIYDEPWLISGDINVVIDDSEVFGQATDTSASMREFNDCVTKTGVYLPFFGAQYSWYNCSEGRWSLWKRLDKMLVNEAWLEHWPHTTYLYAHPRTSDRSPLILQGLKVRRDTILFRFHNFIAKTLGFLQLVTDN